MNIYIFQETNPVATGNVLVGALYKNSAPNTLIDHYTYPAAYDDRTQQYAYENALNVVYRYVCWESPDGTASGTIRNDFKIQPSSSGYKTRDDLYLVADTSGNFNSGGASYGPDASLIGWNWGLESVGAGTLQYGVDYVKTVAGVDTTQDDTNADGWRLLAPGYIIQSGEKFVLHFLPQIMPSAQQPTNIISKTNLITVNTSLDSTAPGQAFLLQGSAGYVKLTLPQLNSVSDNEPIYIISAGGSHVNAGVFSFGGEPIEFYKYNSDITSGTMRDHIYLGQSESITIYRYTNPNTASMYWIVSQGGEGYRTVGEQITSYFNQPINTALLNGQLLSRANYARLWEWIQNLGSASAIVSDTAWSATATLGTNAQTYSLNKGKFSSGDGSSTFRVPDLTLYGFQRTYGSNSGAFEVGHIECHDHTTHGSGGITGSGGPYYLNRAASNASYSAGGSDKFGRGLAPDTTMRTGKDNDAAHTGTQYETAPNITRIYPLIRI